MFSSAVAIDTPWSKVYLQHRPSLVATFSTEDFSPAASNLGVFLCPICHFQTTCKSYLASLQKKCLQVHPHFSHPFLSLSLNFYPSCLDFCSVPQLSSLYPVISLQSIFYTLPNIIFKNVKHIRFLYILHVLYYTENSIQKYHQELKVPAFFLLVYLSNVNF